MVVAPVCAARPVGLAPTGLPWIVAAVVSNLAHRASHAAISFQLYVQPRLEQEVESADAILWEGETVLLHTAIGELYYEARVAFLGLARGA